MNDPRPVIVEACVTSVGQAIAAAAAGANRLELCSRLEVGGLTPEAALVRQVVAAVRIPTFAMIRPRPGSFVTRPGELDAMALQVEEMLAAGAKGIVCGALTESGVIDQTAVERMQAVSGNAPLTFHKAFDDTPDFQAALNALEASGVARVLTSGGAPSAWQGRRALAELVLHSRRTVVIGGGGIRADHAHKLVEETGLVEVHARAQAVPALVAALRE